jgi:hypothetical protein
LASLSGPSRQIFFDEQKKGGKVSAGPLIYTVKQLLFDLGESDFVSIDPTEEADFHDWDTFLNQFYSTFTGTIKRTTSSMSPTTRCAKVTKYKSNSVKAT